jgi:hypothetical protein
MEKQVAQKTPSAWRVGKRLTPALLLIAISLFTRYLGADHRNSQLPLNAVTIQRAGSLRQQLLHPLIDVRVARNDLAELARIPDPRSLPLWKTILLHPASFPSTIRLAAAQSLTEYRGADDDAVAELLCRALAKEPVVEVMRVLARSIELRAHLVPAGLHEIAKNDPRPEWRVYSQRVLNSLENRQPTDLTVYPIARHPLARRQNPLDPAKAMPTL